MSTNYNRVLHLYRLVDIISVVVFIIYYVLIYENIIQINSNFTYVILNSLLLNCKISFIYHVNVFFIAFESTAKNVCMNIDIYIIYIIYILSIYYK